MPTIAQVGWSQARFESICEQLQPFLQQSGFAADRLAFVPCAAFRGENLMSRSAPELTAWYDGPTLVDQLGARHR
jgi:translation elongation factor EF-1alpha